MSIDEYPNFAVNKQRVRVSSFLPFIISITHPWTNRKRTREFLSVFCFHVPCVYVYDLYAASALFDNERPAGPGTIAMAHRTQRDQSNVGICVAKCMHRAMCWSRAENEIRMCIEITYVWRASMEGKYRIQRDMSIVGLYACTIQCAEQEQRIRYVTCIEKTNAELIERK